jgi:hypothetical protein
MRAAALALVLAVSAACGKGGDKKAPGPGSDDRPAPITVEEQTRNADACKAYGEQVCACATAHPDKPVVVDMCKYDQGLGDALDLAMVTARNTETKPDDVRLAQKKARLIATQCMDQLAKLPSLGCP